MAHVNLAGATATLHDLVSTEAQDSDPVHFQDFPGAHPAHASTAATNLIPDVVYIRDRQGLLRVERGNIRLMQADGNYVEIHTVDRRFVLRNSLREVLNQLGTDRFVQVNRHTAVNVERLSRVDCDSLELDGQSVTLSRNYRANLLQHIEVLCGR